MSDYKLKRKVISEGGLISEKEASVLMSKRIVHKEVIRGGSEGDFLEIWYIGEVKG